MRSSCAGRVDGREGANPPGAPEAGCLEVEVVLLGGALVPQAMPPSCAGAGAEVGAAGAVGAAAGVAAGRSRGTRTVAPMAARGRGGTESILEVCSWKAGVTHAPEGLEMPAMWVHCVGGGSRVCWLGVCQKALVWGVADWENGSWRGCGSGVERWRCCAVHGTAGRV